MIATPNKLSSGTTHRFPLLASVCLLLLAWGVAPAAGQINYIFQPLPGDAENDRLWQDLSNWLNISTSEMFVPNAEFNEAAVINNGATAVLTVSMPNSGIDSVVTPGQITVTSGGLDIRSTGALHSKIFTSTNGTSTGNVTIGGGGNALLSVSAGGSLVADGELVFEDINAGYQVEITGASSSGFVDVAGPAELNGALMLQFNGYQPVVGNSWTILEASGFTGGGFSPISSTGDLAYNQAIVVAQADLGGGRFGLNANVEEVLVLEVNRNTGEVKLTHPGTSSITLDGYFIGSDAGLLSDNPNDWNSLTEGGQLGNDWIETEQSTTNIAELKIGADVAFGSDISLGNIYNPFAGQFGQDVEDLTFGFHRFSDGAEFTGAVRYTGSKANTLVLQVDPNGTGDAFLRNTSNTTVQIDAYEILADENLLSVAGWNSLDEQDGPGNIWLEALDNGPTQLAEFDAEGFTTIGPGDSWNLGPLFLGGTDGLSFNFLMMGEEVSSQGVVVYEPFVGVDGDFDGDGDVDGIDFLKWQRGESPIPFSQGDLALWEANYGTSPSNPLTAATQAVPEPATGLLIVLFALAGSCWRSPR